MKQQELEQRVTTAVEHATPDKLETVLSECETRQHAIANLAPQRKKKITGWLRVCAAAAAVVILFVSVYFIARFRKDTAVDSIVMLDVNPSFSLSINSKEKVLSFDALNEDAKAVLGNMDLSGVSLEVAVNALIGSMLQNGYLDELQNSILVSVENDNFERSERLREKVATAINHCMSSDQLEGAVLSQTVRSTDAQIKALSEKYKISLGKAVLIQELISQDATLRFEDLAALSVNEIALISHSKKLAADSISQTGTVSAKAYISKDEALAIACTHAKVSKQDLSELEIEFDSEKGVMIYEVEFRAGTLEYEYDIDAKTGAILKQETENKTGAASGSQDSFIGEAAARDAALQHAGFQETGVTFLHASIEYDDGKPEYYEVEFNVGNKEYEYKIDLYSGAVLSFKTETDNAVAPTADPASPTTAPGSYIGETAAKAAAFAHAGIDEAAVTKIKIEFESDDDDGPVYEIEFEKGNIEYEYEVDARTGAILKYESEIDD